MEISVPYSPNKLFLGSLMAVNMEDQSGQVYLRVVVTVIT